MDFFGVRIVSMDSCNTFFTVLVIVVNRSVVLPTREWLTELASFSATSVATFFAIRLVLNAVRMGARSSSVRVAPPVRFFTPFVSDLNRLAPRPSFSGAFSSSSSSPEDSDSTSTSFMKSSASLLEGKNSAFALSTPSPSSPTSLFFEKSRASMSLFVTLPPSQWRASLPFLDSSFLPAALAFAFAEPPPSPSSSSSSLSFPPFAFFLGAAIPFSSEFFSTSLPFLVSAKLLIACGFLASFASLSTFCLHFMNSASKSTCLMESPSPKASPMLATNSLATIESRLSR
mmetsp:Transcript_17488/g.52585  ORF Transcript_17488/g.52585 Transcript_17488/m.52585 type:complete len:287 (-) Transcript_17488:323-1183(-)